MRHVYLGNLLAARIKRGGIADERFVSFPTRISQLHLGSLDCGFHGRQWDRCFSICVATQAHPECLDRSGVAACIWLSTHNHANEYIAQSLQTDGRHTVNHWPGSCLFGTLGGGSSDVGCSLHTPGLCHAIFRICAKV